MKSIFKNKTQFCLFSLLSIFFVPAKAQNLLNLNEWVVGSGPITGFILSGSSNENSREWGETPQGNRSVLWKAAPNGDANADGGFISVDIPINPSKMYRYTVWIKKTNSKDGRTYLGTGYVINLDGTGNSNPYFWYGVLPELDKWYLLVGFVHGSNDPTTQNYGGVYDGVTGKKVFSATDFKFAETSTSTKIRSFLYYDGNVNDRQYFYGPRLEEVNGNEPTIASLINNANNGENFYFAGKVGIRTDQPGDYDLAVKGRIRTQEVRVEATNWPDYVFNPNYKLLSLEETRKYINTHGHLPGIPDLRAVNEQGISLGEMNRVLLEKIEELTLHLIQKEDDITQLKRELELIKKN
ncbi:tail fiber protein [Sphingobacterium hotanense]|uniref:tail fiber protein n=1 Tax=Sphingobacterium hotanense TaxID=649196 RepID=UPI0021A61073|nr:tail fiber protein [Sphingobacterium hotanense]MCT1526910.1 tail fiber protein [Sphingobacterium hotanense]